MSLVIWISVALAAIAGFVVFRRRVDTGSITGSVRKTAARQLHGKVCIVTGSNSGLGRVTAQKLAMMGAHVIMVLQ